MDVLIVRAPFEIKKTSLTYATKIVDFRGVSVAVRSGLIPVGILPKPKHSGSPTPCDRIKRCDYYLTDKICSVLESLISLTSFDPIGTLS